MKKIVITNAYTWYNKGDAGILLGIVESLKDLYHEKLELTILSFTPEEDKKRYCKDPVIKTVQSNVLNPHPYKHTKLGKMFAIFKLFWCMIYQFVLVNLNLKGLIRKKDNYKSLAEADYIVVCGGGFLGGQKFESFMHLFQIYINTKFKKKVIMMGTSIEPITNRLVKKMTEKILKQVDFIYAREVITYEYLKQFMDEDRFDLIPDMAFMLVNKKEQNAFVETLRENYTAIYGITVRNWSFPGESNPEQKMEEYKKSLVSFMKRAIVEDNAAFVFVPQVIVDYGNDADTAAEIKAMLPEELQQHFIILQDDLHPDEIKSLIGEFDYFIGTRMHSNIFATSMEVPTIAIAYEKKTNGIMHTVGLDDYVLEMNALTAEDLHAKAVLQKENAVQIRKMLQQRITEIREEISQKINLVLKDL